MSWEYVPGILVSLESGTEFASGVEAVSLSRGLWIL